MEQEFNKMTIKGQKSAILLVRALLNSPEQFDYIKDTYLKKCHGSWQLKDKLSVMLDPKTKHEVNYLSKIDKKLSNNNKKYIILGCTVAASGIVAGILLACFILKIGGIL